jgi:hypothetical protein
VAEGSLYDRIVAASGLTPVIAPYTIRRLLLRANVVPPENVTLDEYRRLLPSLIAELRVYLAHDEHEAAVAALRALAA